MKREARKPRKKFIAPKECFFCVDKKEPSFWETGSLTKFLTERGKIIPSSRNGLCIKHQKKLSLSIKHARYLSLIS